MLDPLHEPVSLSEPDPAWADYYEDAASEIAGELSNLKPLIEHIGSTSVPLRAKPIIDIQVAVEEAEVPTAVAALKRLSYLHHGDGGVAGRTYMTRRVAGRPQVNLHVFARGNPLLDDNRLVRDHLRENPEVAREYVAVKRRALDQGHTELRSYSDAKGPFVAAVRDAAYRAKHGLK